MHNIELVGISVNFCIFHTILKIVYPAKLQSKPVKK